MFSKFKVKILSDRKPWRRNVLGSGAQGRRRNANTAEAEGSQL